PSLPRIPRRLRDIWRVRLHHAKGRGFDTLKCLRDCRKISSETIPGTLRSSLKLFLAPCVRCWHPAFDDWTRLRSMSLRGCGQAGFCERGLETTRRREVEIGESCLIVRCATVTILGKSTRSGQVST